MVLLWAAPRKDLVSLLSFPFLSHVQVFSSAIAFVCRLKSPYSCFSSHFLIFFFFVLLMLVLSVLFLVAVISLPLGFLKVISSLCIYASTLSWMRGSPLLLSILGKYILSTSSLVVFPWILSDSHSPLVLQDFSKYPSWF